MKSASMSIFIAVVIVATGYFLLATMVRKCAPPELLNSDSMEFYKAALELHRPFITSMSAIICCGLLSIGIIEGFRKS